ncbi:MAG: sugar ABC transporter permease [Clostridia bacterium]|nr:sugar ABC transporter permease [Clostridia bacterium]
MKTSKSFLFFCTFPALALFLIFMAYPTISVFVMSLYKWGGYSAAKTFVGLNNFRALMEDDRFIGSFRNSVILLVLVSIVTLFLALWCANALTREKIRAKGLFRVIFYIPNILSAVVIAAIFSAIYDPSRGLANSLLSLVGIEPVMWLGNRSVVIYSIAIAMIWQATGYYMVMYMSSMSAVPHSLYEAADIEGASRKTKFFSVTLPLIWTNVRTTLTFFIISSINISFLLVRAMTGGGPDGASEVFLSYMYEQAYTNSSYGYGMAIGVVIFVFSFALSALVNLATRREIVEL